MGGKWAIAMQNHGHAITYPQYKEDSTFVKIPYEKLIKSLVQFGRQQYNQGYTCGLNALNMAARMLGYSFQWDLKTYPPQTVAGFKFGKHSSQFGNTFIKPNFKSYSIKCGDNMPWDLINQTTFPKQVIIILIQCPGTVILHYVLIIGASTKKRYILTDQSEKLYWVTADSLQQLMETKIFTVDRFCAYRVG